MRFPTRRSRLRGVWAALGRGGCGRCREALEESPESRTRHVRQLLYMTHLTRPGGRRVAVPLNPPKSCRAAPHAVWGLESRPPKVRPAPGGSLGTGGVTRAGSQGAIWLSCGKLLLKRGPVSKFFLCALIRFLKLGEGIPRLVVLVWLARQPGPSPPNSPCRGRVRDRAGRLPHDVVHRSRNGPHDVVP